MVGYPPGGGRHRDSVRINYSVQTSDSFGCYSSTNFLLVISRDFIRETGPLPVITTPTSQAYEIDRNVSDYGLKDSDVEISRSVSDRRDCPVMLIFLKNKCAIY